MKLQRKNAETQNSAEILGTRRKVLIVEDNELNREILSGLLEEEYDVLPAENGEIGLRILTEHFRELSLIILDVYMPVMNGFEFLERIRGDALLSGVPVIVATASDNPEDEVKCLKLGASDFVTKPYNPEVVLGRVHSIIKLHESVTTLSVVEYDELTGLYTMQAFQHHVKTLLDSDAKGPFSLAVLDLKGFKAVNSLFGEKKGDQVLAYIGKCHQKHTDSAIMARQGDKFFSLYSGDVLLDEEVIRGQIEKMVEGSPVPKLTVKMGVYRNVDRTLPVSMLCDCVLLASEAIRNDFSRVLSFYDEKLKSRLVEEQEKENRFGEALANGEFVVWYQPKVDTQSEKVVAAEALVRWVPAEGKMVSPGFFVPLFERDGLIIRLDEYVFTKVCELQKRRTEEGRNVVPISVNLSRNSIFQPETVERYTKIVHETGIPFSLVPIEITESACSVGNGVRELADKLTRAGFSLHMDDFGTGYSSLSSLTSMPFDVIKLDKSLIDRIGNERGNTVIRHMVSLAQEMGMRTVAEGVELEKQLDYLKKIGCDMIQGYYFSPPRDQHRFEDILDHSDETLVLDLGTEYRRIKINMSTEFELSENAMSILKHVSDGMMEGFFIYRATSDETLLYANRKTLEIFGCKDMLEFRKLTGNTFRGLVHPDEYIDVEKSIFRQINNSAEDSDAVQYHIIRKDGSIGYVCDEGHCVHTETYGNIFYVFIQETAEKTKNFE